MDLISINRSDLLPAHSADQTEVEAVTNRAAAYVRMSTEHQQFSTGNQLEVIREFARQRGLELVETFSDEGKSGLTIQGRAALSQLITEVMAGNVNYAHILVYDVSRWGRFQDTDEAAHYEFLCRQAGVTVHYCAEQFVNDGGLTATIAKNFKRAMAAEFSRELSAKAFQGACRGVRLGFCQGGTAVLGLCRMLVDQTGQPKMRLQPGDRKHLQTDRVILVPGPADEIQTVRWIFKTFVEERVGATEIARRLNEQGQFSKSGRPWTECKMRNLLRNEHYIGNLVYARRSGKLKRQSVPNPPSQWIRKDQAFEGIIPRELFFTAQERFKPDAQKFQYTDMELLEKLRHLHDRHGYLTGKLIDKTPDAPVSHTYNQRFGSLLDAYRLAGFKPRSHYRLAGHRRVVAMKRKMVRFIQRQLENMGLTATWHELHGTLLLNQELRVRVLFIRPEVAPGGTPSWRIRQGARIKCDLTMAVRMDLNDEVMKDYYLLPKIETKGKATRLSGRTGAYLDGYRFETLDYLVGLAARSKVTL